MAPPVARPGFNEVMAMAGLPNPASSAEAASTTRRFISHTPPWTPGQDLPKEILSKLKGRRCYGGHVYIQAALAAARVAEQEQEQAQAQAQARAQEQTGRGASAESLGKMGIHSIQGVFTVAGLADRPFLYEVTNVSSSKSFSTKITTARQPTQSSSNPLGPFPTSDAALPLGDVAFTCITTLRRPFPSPADAQQDPTPWERFAPILRLKTSPDQWPASPQVDLDSIHNQPGAAAAAASIGYGTFPIVDMHKVDMGSWNAGRPLPERRELILYRLRSQPRQPLQQHQHQHQQSDPDPNDVNAHVLCHAFEADRNGLLMLMRHLGWGSKPGLVASLSYAFFVHTNAEEAVMRGGEWWLQEACWPRASAGRGMVECRIWSPDGRHVATGYQDGISSPAMGSKI